MISSGQWPFGVSLKNDGQNWAEDATLSVRLEELTLQTRLNDIQRVENQRRHDGSCEARGGVDARHLRLGPSILFLHYDEGV